MKIIFFDASCALCQRSVHFILHIDRAHRFRFAPLKGETADQYLNEALKSSNSLVLVEGKKFWVRGKAVCRILWQIGGWWKIFGAFSFVPFGIDLVYRIIAHHRHRFGAAAEGSFSTEERKYFLP